MSLRKRLEKLETQVAGKPLDYQDFTTGPELEALFEEIENWGREQKGLLPLPVPETEPDPKLEAEIDAYLEKLDELIDDEQEGEGHA